MAVTKLRPIFEYYLLESSNSKFQSILTSRNTVIDVYMYFLFHLKCRWTTLELISPVPHDSIQTVTLVNGDLLLRVVPPLIKGR